MRKTKAGRLHPSFIAVKRPVIFTISFSLKESVTFLRRFSGDTAEGVREMLGSGNGPVQLGLPFLHTERDYIAPQQAESPVASVVSVSRPRFSHGRCLPFWTCL